MHRFLQALFVLLLAAAIFPDCPALAADPGLLGVVVMHGKHGAPDRYVSNLASALRAEGYLVATPEMPGSKRRAYNVSYQDAMKEIDSAVQELRSRGAVSVVVAGQSLGANAALAYASGHPGLPGVICLTPGHNPERTRWVEQNADALRRAKELVAAGRGGEMIGFTDFNGGNTFNVSLPAGVFLSYFDPEGLAAMPLSAARIKPPVPLLWVVGKRDPLSKLGASYAFERAPAHALSRYAEIDADHLGTATAAIPLVLEWLKALPR